MLWRNHANWHRYSFEEGYARKMKLIVQKMKNSH